MEFGSTPSPRRLRAASSVAAKRKAARRDVRTRIISSGSGCRISPGRRPASTCPSGICRQNAAQPPQRVVGGQFQGDAVSGQDANPIPAQLAGEMGQDRAFLIELHAKQAAGEFLHNSSGDFNTVFFAHFPRWRKSSEKYLTRNSGCRLMV